MGAKEKNLGTDIVHARICQDVANIWMQDTRGPGNQG